MYHDKLEKLQAKASSGCKKRLLRTKIQRSDQPYTCWESHY